MKNRIITILLVIAMSPVLYATEVLTYIYTPKGNIVPDTYLISGYTNPSLTEAQMQYLQNRMNVLYDGAQIIGNIDYRYNCHAYAWHLSENPNYEPVWVGRHTTTAEDKYWNDGSYVCVPEDISTKVSYHSIGNHSAIREDNVWYKSKWGGWFLVKHHPNAVPNGIPNDLINDTTNYHSELAKTYYRRYDFDGNTVPCDQSVYSVDHLTSGYNVEWSFQNSTSPAITNLLTANYPTAVQSTISNPDHVYIKDTLLAAIKKNGNHIATLKKEIDTGANFIGSYTGTYIGTLLPGEPIPANIPSTILYSGKKLSIMEGYRLTLTSDYFQNATVNYTGNCIYDWINNGQGGISFSLRSSQSPGQNKIYGYKGCDVFEITILVMNNVIPFSLLVTSSGRVYEIAIDCQESYMSINDLNELEWTILIYNAFSNKLVYSEHVTGRSHKIDTTGWESGVYIINAQVGNKVITEKIALQ